METLNEKAGAMLQRCGIVILTSVNKDGYPRPVPLARVKSEGFSTVWVATGLNSLKIQDFLQNPKAGLCFFETENSVALTGEVEVITDGTVKKELWQDWFIAHFPQGPTDPNYAVLKFQGQHSTIWIDGEFVHGKIGV